MCWRISGSCRNDETIRIGERPPRFVIVPVCVFRNIIATIAVGKTAGVVPDGECSVSTASPDIFRCGRFVDHGANGDDSKHQAAPKHSLAKHFNHQFPLKQTNDLRDRRFVKAEQAIAKSLPVWVVVASSLCDSSHRLRPMLRLLQRYRRFRERFSIAVHPFGMNRRTGFLTTQHQPIPPTESGFKSLGPGTKSFFQTTLFRRSLAGHRRVRLLNCRRERKLLNTNT